MSASENAELVQDRSLSVCRAARTLLRPTYMQSSSYASSQPMHISLETQVLIEQANSV